MIARTSHLAGVFAVESDTRHVFPRHTHDQFGIGVLEAGAQTSLSGRGEVEAEAGDVISVNPGEVHDGRPVGSAGRSWRMLYLDPPLVAAMARELGGRGAGEFRLPVARDPRLAAEVRRLFAAVTREDPGEGSLRRESALLRVVAAASQPNGPADPRPGVPAAIRRAVQLVDDDPAAAHTLDALAGASGLSRFQVVRGFARATGLPPHAYLLQRRVQLARQLVAAGTPLAEVAARCGFADQSHLTRVFGRTFGLPPGAYAAPR